MNNEPLAHTIHSRSPLSIDGVQRAPQPPMPAPLAAAERPYRRAHFKPVPTKKQHRLWQRLQLPALLLIGMCGGLFAENLAIGLSLLVIYGIVAFAARVPSRTSFTLALLLLAAISALLCFKPNRQLIGNFATYAFVLLIIGVLTLGREARLPKRSRPRRHR